MKFQARAEIVEEPPFKMVHVQALTVVVANGNNATAQELKVSVRSGTRVIESVEEMELVNAVRLRRRSVTFEAELQTSRHSSGMQEQEATTPKSSLASALELRARPILLLRVRRSSRLSLEEKVLNAIDLICSDEFPSIDIYDYNTKVYLERCILDAHRLRRCIRMFNFCSNIRNILIYAKHVWTLKAIATFVNIPFVSVTGSKLYSKHRAESHQMVQEVFLRATSIQPCILFFIDADKQCGSGKDAATRDVKVQFCTQLDNSMPFNRAVFVIVATDKPWQINDKLMARFQEKIFVDCAGRPYRLKMKAFRMKNDPKYDPERENYYSLLDAFHCFG